MVAVLVLAGSSLFAVFVAVVIVRRAGEYVVRSAGPRDAMEPLDRETKYKAKTGDVPVYRGADYVIAQGQDAIREPAFRREHHGDRCRRRRHVGPRGLVGSAGGSKAERSAAADLSCRRWTTDLVDLACVNNAALAAEDPERSLTRRVLVAGRARIPIESQPRRNRGADEHAALIARARSGEA